MRFHLKTREHRFNCTVAVSGDCEIAEGTTVEGIVKNNRLAKALALNFRVLVS